MMKEPIYKMSSTYITHKHHACINVIRFFNDEEKTFDLGAARIKDYLDKVSENILFLLGRIANNEKITDIPSYMSCHVMSFFIYVVDYHQSQERCWRTGRPMKEGRTEGCGRIHHPIFNTYRQAANYIVLFIKTKKKNKVWRKRSSGRNKM